MILQKIYRKCCSLARKEIDGQSIPELTKSIKNHDLTNAFDKVMTGITNSTKIHFNQFVLVMYNKQQTNNEQNEQTEFRQS